MKIPCAATKTGCSQIHKYFKNISLFKKIIISHIIAYWNAKVESQEMPGVTGKFGLGIQNEAGQRLIEFFHENALVIANTLFQQ